MIWNQHRRLTHRIVSSWFKYLETETRYLNRRTAIHHHPEARSRGAIGGNVIGNAELHPDRRNAQTVFSGNGVINSIGCLLRAAEYINHINRFCYIHERRNNGLVVNDPSCDGRVHRNNPNATSLKEAHHTVRRSLWFMRGSDHRDAAKPGQNLGKVFVCFDRHAISMHSAVASSITPVALIRR